MFTEGLDESAINWVNQGRAVDELRSPLSPLTETRSPVRGLFPKSPRDPLAPRSPLLYSSASSQLLPPLKFSSSGFLTPRTLVPPSFSDQEDDGESVASVSDYTAGNYSLYGGDEDGEDEVGSAVDLDFLERPVAGGYEDVEMVFAERPKRKLNRGLLKEDLKIEVPGSGGGGGLRRFTTDGGVGIRKPADLDGSTTSHGNYSLRERAQLSSSRFAYNLDDFGTPSAPPAMEVGREDSSYGDETEAEQSGDGICKFREPVNRHGVGESLLDPTLHSVQSTEFVDTGLNSTVTDQREVKMPYWQTTSLDQSYTSGQHAWQTLIAYDACIRLCLYSWAKGCTEAPEFMRDECLLLRSAFGLHKFLLQPRGVQATEVRTAKNAEQMGSSRVKKVVGKIRVDVRKLRVVPRRALKSSNSMRSAIYMQMGKDYARQVSSLVKNGMNSLKLASFPAISEEKMPCFFQLKSDSEGAEVESASTICLHPGSGEYHVFFPESEGDALLVEVQDSKQSLQGRATIPISSLNENPNDRIRWWPLYLEGQECVGKIQLSISSTITCDETNSIKSGPVAETLAYDLLLEAAMRAQHFHARNLKLDGPWNWLLTEFADYYGVSGSYTKLRYLSHIMNVATPTKDCLELVNELLVPIFKARSEKSLTRQEKSILLDCETQIEKLLATVFENYKSLDESSPTGLADLFGPVRDSAAPALTPAVNVYTLLHDVLSHDAQIMLQTYLQAAAKKRCRKHMIETDEFVSCNSEGYLLDSITVSTAYLKMKNLCMNISKEIQADIKIHNQDIFPSSIDLSNISAAVYSTELCNRLSSFLSAWPPSSPQPHVNELLTAIADFERDLDLWEISTVEGGVEARGLFHSYIIVWVQDMELNLLELCKAEKVPWAGVTTNHATSPFAEEMYDKMKDYLIRYEVVINRWPQYSLILETAAANMERAIIKALEKQYSDILTPLKDSIPKRLNMHVQKLARRQSMAPYSVPNQLGTFLNTIKRIVDVLHCRVEEILRSWASCLPVAGDKRSSFGEQMNGITVLLKTKYKNYLQATVEKLVNNMQANRGTRLKRILEEIKEEDGEADVRERMQMLTSQLIDSISNLHGVFSSRIFVAASRGLWDRMGQIVLKFLEGRKENRVWYNGSCYALGILDDIFASQMQRLLGNSLQDKDIEPPRSVIEARSILCRDVANAADTSTYFYV
ncbi:unnamed protein product [Linum trigynum]|uniref:Uncharacterized protein n=1 Tax=Linum trigynum TaxID=586398 RepID=A0AAV2GCG0_9ROSI